jgi:TRAP-type transport system periplasmic protein
MDSSRRTFSKLAIGAAAVSLFSAPAIHAQPARLRVVAASLLAEDKPETQIWRFFAERVDVHLPGRFDFRIVASAALGGERDVAEGLRLGSIQASLSTLSSLSAWVPETQLFDLPYLFRDADHLARVTAGPGGGELKAILARSGFQATAFVDYGARHLLTRTPVTRPQELAGQRIRVIQSPAHQALWQAYGASPQAIPIPETYNALATGVVDCMDLTKSAYAGFRLHEVVPCLTETAHIRAAGIINFGASFWDQLDRPTRDVFAAVSQESAAHFNTLMIKDEQLAMQQAMAAGATLHQPADRAEWADPAMALWPELAAPIGGMASVEAIRAME